MVKKGHGRVKKPGSSDMADGDALEGNDQPWVKPNSRLSPNTSGKQIGFYRRKGLVVGGHEDYEEDCLNDEFEYDYYPDNE